jgi:hypothetical protein
LQKVGIDEVCMLTQLILNGSNRLHQWVDNQRVKQHFKCVDRVLCAASTTSLPAPLHEMRLHHLAVLRKYAHCGMFPRNYDNPERTPVFIDREGRRCAVAHLLSESGQQRIATTISQQANFATVPEMHFAELDQRAAESGFTRDELALIQPAYSVFHMYHVFTPLLWMTVLSAFATLLNIRSASLHKGWQIFLSVVALAVSIQSLMYLPELLMLGPSIKADYLPHAPLGLNYHHIYNVRFFFLHPFTDAVHFQIVEAHTGLGFLEILLGLCTSVAIASIVFSAKRIIWAIRSHQRESATQGVVTTEIPLISAE